jgi:2-polyprenyl-3-methyl-5-hydroxy-6-metoxy-1,4-benzoquinol methylase
LKRLSKILVGGGGEGEGVEEKALKAKILDVGTGTCPLLFKLAEGGFDNLNGVDFSATVLTLTYFSTSLLLSCLSF